MLTGNLLDLLSEAAKNGPSKGITAYHSGGGGSNTSFLTYENLLAQSKQRSMQIRKLVGVEKKVVLMYFADHLESITWFWAIIYAGAVPCICPRLSQDLERRKESIGHLRQLLEEPLIITSKTLTSEFSGLDCPKILSTDDIEYVNCDNPYQAVTKMDTDLAALMLTSGSTSNPKAVCLTHGQILAAVRAKSVQHGTSHNDVFLNWIGLDHVANLTDNHLHAVSLAAQQVHVQGEELLVKPLSFLQHISNHKITITFAPNFFLASLVHNLETVCSSAEVHKANNPTSSFDLSSLRALLSGGESNVVDTCHKLTRLLWQYGAPKTFIRPGFGMTETCAGCTQNVVDCPWYDIEHGAEFCTLGNANKAIKMRIVRRDVVEASVNEVGSLEVSGPAVFSSYFNDSQATEAAFSPDGWFKTGDVGLLDSNGRLRLTGREKDNVIINGINHSSESIESAIEQTSIPEITPSFTVVWPHRPKDSPTETLCIAYLPAYPSNDTHKRLHTAAAISRAVVKYCGARPFKIIPLPDSLLQKSSLGKLSRSKIRRAFEEGAYLKYEAEDKAISQRNIGEVIAENSTQKTVLKTLHELLTLNSSQLMLETHLDSDLFDLGLSSIDLLKLRASLQKSLNMANIPITIFFSHPILRHLTQAIEDLQKEKPQRIYDPISLLQPHGTKTPLFLIHPGVGDVLIFMNLARLIDDRPVYALRARGFDADEEYFSSMQEIITVYHSAIKRVQPTGPYAIAGYALGSNLAFEIAKVMQASGDRVQFLAAVNQPPNIKDWARRRCWYNAVLAISLFMGLVTQDYYHSALVVMQREKTSHDEVLDRVLELAGAARLQETGMTRKRLQNWADLAYELRDTGKDYEPAGSVGSLDVFLTELEDEVWGWPWEDVSKWGEFAESIDFHRVKGSHLSLMAPPHVHGFQGQLKKVLEERGL